MVAAETFQYYPNLLNLDYLLQILRAANLNEQGAPSSTYQMLGKVWCSRELHPYCSRASQPHGSRLLTSPPLSLSASPKHTISLSFCPTEINSPLVFK